MIIVKVGGSVFSDKKGEPENFDHETVSNIAREIAKFYPREDFIIVHGGGSFGHPEAKRYEIREGLPKEWETAHYRRIGFTLTHQAMLRANAKFIETFVGENLPAFSVSTSSVFITENGEVSYGDLEVIERLLDLKFIPVLFGDVSIDLAKGIDILSGDQIITYLAKMLEPEKVIFLMDVDGIYDGKPGEGRLIQELRKEEIDSLLERLHCTSAGTDVTGGICNKLGEAKKIAEHSEVWFVNGKVPGRLSGAIRGDGFGTRIKM
ncbi:isopentenyl phosphate kinase family protein [Thermococcus indicus]|uniref:Isopentenyl phosphate kinase n=1 Tax=Thermococcus indicus TaxID=2586643 RepID=A0A4Y5SIZ9_9EURY|nr:isopentenyl phosphate kinase [Thermococcus indicus]QDA30823.1 isopentenyl phosphate kinase family protein [Thermococcus indicus]